MRTSKRTVNGSLSVHSGSEGPCHDPYSYHQYEFVRGDDKYVLHLGLGTWFRRNNTHDDSIRDEQLAIESFEKAVGLTLPVIDKALHRRPKLSAKERRLREELEYADAQLLRYAL